MAQVPIEGQGSPVVPRPLADMCRVPLGSGVGGEGRGSTKKGVNQPQGLAGGFSVLVGVCMHARGYSECVSVHLCV